VIPLSILELAKKVFSKEEDVEELDLEISSSDGCKGEEIIAKVINKLRPC